VVGEGVVDFPSIFAVLRTAGYDGWLSLEAGGPKGREGIQRGIAYVRETWEGCGR
jgi:sugar phosphate isomerase/epimerase